MPDLQTLQDMMTTAILGGDIGPIASELRAGRANAASRFNIFRNNSYTSLTECLKSVFPVTVRLSDERFFAYAAHEFIANRPPREARLSCYGAEFPRFLARFEPCRSFPIIAEMAALEWAIAGTLNEAEEAPAPISLIAEAGIDGGETGLRLQPNLRFAVARWPLLGVWSDHKKEHGAIKGPLKRKISRVTISRHGDDIQLMELEPSRFAFWRALSRGQSIEMAASRALARDPLFDLVQETIALFRSRLVTGVLTPVEQGI
jgi:Putative DNA-binding domain